MKRELELDSKKNSSDAREEKEHMEYSSESPQCFACGKSVPDPQEENHLVEEIICDSCRQELFTSLEAAWVKHSAFLDSALN